MAEHYATNAQHELDRLAISQPSSARIAHVLRLHASYSALAATAQLPNDSDFEELESAEEFESERMAFVHSDRLALMSTDPKDTAPPASRTRLRSPVHVSTNVNNSVVPRNVRNRRRSRESSVESIIREDGFDSRVHDHHNHVDRNQWVQEYAAPPHHNQLAPFFPLQALTGFLQPPWPYGGNTYHYTQMITVVNNYYSFAPPQQPQYEFGGDDDQNGSSVGSPVSHGRRRRGRRGGRGRDAN